MKQEAPTVLHATCLFTSLVCVMSLEIIHLCLDTAIQCSVIPYYDPKCFPLTLDLTDLQKSVKEITFTPKKDHVGAWDERATLNQQPLQVDGIEVGSQARDDLGRTGLSQCRKDFENYRDEKHGTKFKYYDVQVHGLTLIEASARREAEKPAKSLFVTTKRELWKCKNSEGREFQRVLTESVSKVPIVRLAYYPGTSVAKVPIPRKTSADRLLYTAVIREIKYFNPNTGQSIKYEGNIKFVPELMGDRVSTPVYKDFIHADSGFNYYPNFQHYIFNDEGNIILIDEQPVTSTTENIPMATIIKEINLPKGSKAICKSIEKEQLEAMSGKIRDRLPQWSYARHQSKNSQRLQPSEIHDWQPLQFLDYFIVTKHETRFCTVVNNKESFRTEEFFRTEIIYVGKTEDIRSFFVHGNNGKEIGTFLYRYRLTQNKIDLPDSMAGREVIYFKAENPEERLKINGEVEIRGPSFMKKAKRFLSGLFKAKKKMNN
ncbi:hypothetical protein LSTR_LSTR006585 [Laodelphax striatellus]|uniref:Glycosyltransferase family 92 protein n=1 Tax=Laodelphax striatellus TaxID=195883 RepID=A0A482WT30_LAOST|nr:hypothetical protein LSTR_LSTR006585 [Laodelphax striatellus]